jgi:acetyl esterase/lipase
MKNLCRHIVRAAIAVILAMSGSSVFISPMIALAEDPSTTSVDADGTLHIRALAIPTSNLWSPEFKNAYAKIVAMSGTHPFMQTPGRNAPKAEWDKLDADLDRMVAEPLAWDLEHYPVNVEETKIAGVHVGIISPKGGIAPENQSRVLINLHGGGFLIYRGLVMGQLASAPISSIGRIKVITVDYREAPYYKYPAASEDVAAVYKELLKQYKPEAIGIFGCSAGGMLTAQAVAWFQAKGLPRPGAVGIFCAGLPAAPFPFGKGGDSKIWGQAGILEIQQPMAPAFNWYLEGVDINDPQAYPSSSDTVLAKFPPTLILSGTRSFDMSPAVVAHARFLKLGVDSSLYIIEGGWHAAFEAAVGTPEIHDANVYIAHWFNQHLAR